MRALAGVFLAALIVAVGSGCGTGGPAEGGNANQGKKLFLSEGKCGGCHTLKAAASSGQIGPNLDEAFRQDKVEGFEESGIQNVVLDQIRFPRDGSVMLPDLVEGQDAVDVAAFVAKCAAADPEDDEDRLACPGIVAKPGGEGLYTSLGCLGCHSIDGSASSGPTLKGVFNSMVPLANWAEREGRRAVPARVDPRSRQADREGLPAGRDERSRPAGSVPQDQAQELVDYIKTLK